MGQAVPSYTSKEPPLAFGLEQPTRPTLHSSCHLCDLCLLVGWIVCLFRRPAYLFEGLGVVFETRSEVFQAGP